MTVAHTLAGPATFELEAKRSRVLSRAASVESPEAALAFLHEVADPQATHNCWAYRIGADYRSSDDGEPGGSAGRPILAAIEGQGVDQVMVVVTRWYGGTNLGVGGLVRAYGGAAAECLRTAPRRELVDWREASLAWARLAFGLKLRRLWAPVLTLPLIAEPGTAYHYSLSLDVLGLVIQRVSGFSRSLNSPMVHGPEK